MFSRRSPRRCHSTNPVNARRETESWHLLFSRGQKRAVSTYAKWLVNSSLYTRMADQCLLLQDLLIPCTLLQVRVRASCRGALCGYRLGLVHVILNIGKLCVSVCLTPLSLYPPSLSLTVSLPSQVLSNRVASKWRTAVFQDQALPILQMWDIAQYNNLSDVCSLSVFLVLAFLLFLFCW